MSQSNKKRYTIAIIAILAVYALLLGVFTIVNYDHLITTVDTESYTCVAENMLAGQGFADSSGEADGYRTPGYPLFLMAVFALGGNLTAVVVVQLLLAVATLYLVYRICLIMNVRPVYSLICAGLYLLDISLYIYTGFAISDSFFYFVLVLSAYFLARFIKNKSFWSFLIFVAVLNFALATRPILMYYNGLVCLFVLVLCILKKLPLKALFATVLIFAVVFGGWSFRNYCRTGVFEMSNVRNHNLMYFDSAVLRSEVEGIAVSEARARFEQEYEERYADRDLDNMSLSERRVFEGEIGNEYIKAHFGAYLVQNIKGLFNTMFGPNREFLNTVMGSTPVTRAVELLYMAYLGIVYVLYVLGWILNLKKANWLDLFILTVSGYCAAASASLGYARFRVAFFGLLLVGAFVLWKDSDILERIKGLFKGKKKKVS